MVLLAETRSLHVSGRKEELQMASISRSITKPQAVAVAYVPRVSTDKGTAAVVPLGSGLLVDVLVESLNEERRKGFISL